MVPATAAEIAEAYRALVPLPNRGTSLDLDTRGRAAWTGGGAQHDVE